MENIKVISVNKDSIEFEHGIFLTSEHERDCCEHHYLDFSGLDKNDFEGLIFDLTNDDFFEKIEDYGIALLPKNNFPVRVPGYGSNNGYYSTNLALSLTDYKKFKKTFDITECQTITY